LAAKRRFGECSKLEAIGDLAALEELLAKKREGSSDNDIKFQKIIASGANTFFTSSSISKLCEIVETSDSMPEVFGNLSVFLVNLPRSTYLGLPRTDENQYRMRLAVTAAACTIGSSDCAENGKLLDQACMSGDYCSASSFRQVLFDGLNADELKIVLQMESQLVKAVQTKDCTAVGFYR
jgi:hypothetical protein